MESKVMLSLNVSTALHVVGFWHVLYMDRAPS